MPDTKGKSMQENKIWGMTWGDYLRANPHGDFEAKRERFAEIQEANKRHNAQTRREYLARLEADKSQKRLEDKQAAAVAELAKEAKVKRQLRYKYATMTEAQYDSFWPEIFKEFLMVEARLADAAFRKNYQF